PRSTDAAPRPRPPRRHPSPIRTQGWTALHHLCAGRSRLPRSCVLGAAPPARLRLPGVAEVMAGRIEVGLSYIDQARLMFELPGPGAFEREDALPQFFAAHYIAGDWSRARDAM